MIRIGNQTAFSAANLTAPFEYALTQGFDAFEWFPDKKPDGTGWDDTDLDASQRLSIRETARARGVRLSVHARWQADPLRPESEPLLKRDLELAHALGAALLVLHLYGDWRPEAFIEAIKPLIHATAQAGLQLAIENTPEHAPEQFNELFAQLRALESVPIGHVGMCLDLGHANLCAATRNDYLSFFDRLDPWVPIIHLHLHENWGDADRHLPLFTGPAGRDDSGIRGLLARLARRHYSGSIILEQWPQPPALLTQARDRLGGLLSEVAVRHTPTPLTETPPTCATPPSDFLETLVRGNDRCRSWREKLDFLRGLFASETTPLTAENLVDLAVYLRFLGTGQIPCAEDGRHFRPAHHARIALQIQERLAQLSTPDNAYIVRRIQPWLPSSGETFRRPEPLTRIRDIAHRNDIPSDLKHEIKHALQNKLHRCAGPEDLLTATALLERITAPHAGYPAAFVEEFKTFHEELKEFFNARSLEDRLKALRLVVAPETVGLIESFLAEKPRTDLRNHLAALAALTRLREALLRETGWKPGIETHEFVQADLGLEDFSFVLLSEISNELDKAREHPDWEAWLEPLVLTLTNLALSQVEPAECGAIENELRAWGQRLEATDPEELLRLKATVDRARRLAEGYSERILSLFPQRAQKLGHSLGVAPEAIQAFCEAEIRSHLVFQLSKLASSQLRRLRHDLGLPAWDVLVVGRAEGLLQFATGLEDLVLSSPEPVIALLDHAEGDEEIPSHVRGILLAHEIPHLSHLGVRARQAGVVFVTCEEPAPFNDLQRLKGHWVSLTATPDTVACKASDPRAPADEPDRSGVVPPLSTGNAGGEGRGEGGIVQGITAQNIGSGNSLPEVRLNPTQPWIAVQEVTAETGGGKACGARRLAELAAPGSAGFQTPATLVVPFGVMEAALDAEPAVQAEYRRLQEQLDQLPPEDFAATVGRLRILIRQLPVPGEISSTVTAQFGRTARLMVRSSANCEDLEALAGAGLYDSIANVAASEVASAVAAVWASLWTRRAAWSRQQAGLRHAQAHMAVVIQEMLTPDLSFVLHTVNPIHGDPREVYAEIAVGLGETLASGAARGTPFRMVIHKDTGAVRMLAFANFSQAVWPDREAGLTRATVDYSGVELSSDVAARRRLGQKLAAISCLVETAFQRPQDIEGAMVKDQIYLVQARPQPGLARPPQA